MTKSSLLTIAFVFISILCFGQSSKVNMGFELYTNMADRNVDNEALSDIIKPKFNISGGFVLSYRIKPKLAFVSGITLMNKGYQTKSNAFNWGDQHNGEGGFHPDIVVANELDEITIKNNYYILSVPLNVRYAFSESLNKGWYLQGGVAPAFYWFDRTKVIQETGDGKEVSNEKNILDNARTVNLNLNLGFGYAFLLKEKYQISIGPSIEYMPFDLIKDAVWKSTFYSYGLTTRFMFL